METGRKRFGLIICAGPLSESRVEACALAALPEPDAVYCADGGMDRFLSLSRMGALPGKTAPDALVGDFDSIGRADGEAGSPAPGLAVGDAGGIGSARVVRYPEDKDQTDSELAYSSAARDGCDSLLFLGALGGRLDHSLANLCLLARAARDGIMAVAIDGLNAVAVLHGRAAPKGARGRRARGTGLLRCGAAQAPCPDRLRSPSQAPCPEQSCERSSKRDPLPAQLRLRRESTLASMLGLDCDPATRNDPDGARAAGGSTTAHRLMAPRYVSILPYGGMAHGVSLSGLKYSFTGSTLHRLCSTGVSNEFTESLATIRVERGDLLVSVAFSRP